MTDPSCEEPRHIDPKSLEQSAKWVKQTYGWGGKAPSAGRPHTSSCLFVSRGNGTRPTGERLRPLARPRAMSYGDTRPNGHSLRGFDP
jgi:hypothetical protein